MQVSRKYGRNTEIREWSIRNTGKAMPEDNKLRYGKYIGKLRKRMELPGKMASGSEREGRPEAVRMVWGKGRPETERMVRREERPGALQTVRRERKSRGKFRRAVGLALLLGAAAADLTGCSVVEQVRYELSDGGVASWEQEALEEGIVSSAEEYYYDHLPDDLRETYRELFVRIMRNEDSGKLLSSVGVDDFWKVYYSVLADHPEIFWIGTSAQVEESGITGRVVSYQFEVTVPVEARSSMQEQLEEEADACTAQIPAESSVYEKIKLVYEYIIDQTEYDAGSQDSQNIQSVLLYNRSVCAGYSKAFQYILNRMGIFCTYISGTIRDGGDHAWNMVRIDDQYYYVDVTWGDPVFANQMENTDAGNVTNYNYLCCTQTDLFRTHVPGDLVELPECLSDDYNYYKRNGYYYENFDYNTIYNALMDSVWNWKPSIVMKFGTQEAYETARYELFENNMLKDPGNYLMDVEGVRSWNYRYHTDDDFWLITIYWR